MASISTRSSRRTEGLTTRSSTRNNVVATLQQGSNINNTSKTKSSSQQQLNTGRKKRLRDAGDHEEQQVIYKKARFTVEIDSRPKTQPKSRSLILTANANSLGLVHHKHPASPPPPQQHAKLRSEPPPPRRPANHHEKVVNGIKDELDRLQSLKEDAHDAKRKLRSQEGTRFKSELSAYFPEYDEVIGNEPKEEHILNLDTPIIIIDSSATTSKQQPSSEVPIQEYPVKQFPDSLFHKLHDAHRVDLSFLDKNYKEIGAKDILHDAYFESIHRRPERQEKAIRNSDKGRAQHEKDQVIRLLEGLQGHDWLKLMGVSGITDSRKKEYEPARAHFIKGCEGIIEKFRTWREEEKRRRLERELAIAEAEAEEDEQEEEGEEEEGEEEHNDNFSDGDPPDYSDVDASAARQLHEEAIARSAPLIVPKRSAKHTKVEKIPLAEHTQEKEFKSFFSKPYLREAALGKHRRSGRSVAAWGHPVPEVPVGDFNLPGEYRDEETMKVHARRKRRDRRVSKD